jgi:hypothetical protein
MLAGVKTTFQKYVQGLKMLLAIKTSERGECFDLLTEKGTIQVDLY